MSEEQLAKKATSICLLGDFLEEVGQQLSEEGDWDAKGAESLLAVLCAGVMVELNSLLLFSVQGSQIPKGRASKE